MQNFLDVAALVRDTVNEVFGDTFSHTPPGGSEQTGIAGVYKFDLVDQQLGSQTVSTRQHILKASFSAFDVRPVKNSRIAVANQGEFLVSEVIADGRGGVRIVMSKTKAAD